MFVLTDDGGMEREKATSKETKKATSSASTGLVIDNIRLQYCPVHDDHFSLTSSVRKGGATPIGFGKVCHWCSQYGHWVFVERPKINFLYG